MKRLLLVGFALALTAQAFAADVPQGRRYMPPPRGGGPTYVPFFSWSGLYVGVNAGYGFGHSKWTSAASGATTGDFTLDGALIGGTMGYNMQLGGAVVGVEGDLGWSNIKGSTTALCLGSCETRNNWLGTLRGRIGYAFDRFLPYLTAGAAFGDIEASTSPDSGSFNRSNIGWTAGGGLEYAFFSNWSAKLEYLYVDLGKASCNTTCGTTAGTDVTFTTSVVRAGLNYKF
jgi:outer membrane immunogenic protein